MRYPRNLSRLAAVALLVITWSPRTADAQSPRPDGKIEQGMAWLQAQLEEFE